MNRDQSGFSIVELLVIVLCLSIIVILGWILFDRSHGHNKPKIVHANPLLAPATAWAKYTSKQAKFTALFPTAPNPPIPENVTDQSNNLTTTVLGFYSTDGNKDNNSVNSYSVKYSTYSGGTTITDHDFQFGYVLDGLAGEFKLHDNEQPTSEKVTNVDGHETLNFQYVFYDGTVPTYAIGKVVAVNNTLYQVLALRNNTKPDYAQYFLNNFHITQ